MILRFGYVSTALSLWESSPSRTLTFTRWKELDEHTRKEKLHKATKENLNNTLRALYFNIASGIKLYRMSSSLVPLATHPEVDWDYYSPFKQEFREIGDLVKKFSLRVSFHPNQFTLFTSPRDQVTENAIIDMKYHYHMLEAMGLQTSANINIHIGGMYGNKEQAIQRFHENIQKLDQEIRKQTTLENDDKTYNADETLEICEHHSIPFVFDYHHHIANLGTLSIRELLPHIYSTWKNVNVVPKFHLSSPKSERQFRAHADHVNVDFILPFIKELKEFGHDADIMIEAKLKDKAALKLVEELSKIRGFTRISGAEIQV